MRRLIAVVIATAAMGVAGYAYAEGQPADPAVPEVAPPVEVPPVDVPPVEVPPVVTPNEDRQPEDGPTAGAAGNEDDHEHDAGEDDADESKEPKKPKEPKAAKTEKADDADGAARGWGLGRFKGAVHGELTLADGESTRQVTFDRGRVTAISEGSLSLRRLDGVDVSVAITPETVFNGPRDKVAAGDPVLVFHAGGNGLRIVARGAMAQACDDTGPERHPGFCQRPGDARGAAKPGRGPKKS